MQPSRSSFAPQLVPFSSPESRDSLPLSHRQPSAGRPPAPRRHSTRPTRVEWRRPFGCTWRVPAHRNTGLLVAVPSE